MITLKTCPICKGENIIKKTDCIDYSTSKETFTIVSCETCSFVFTNPRPKEKNLGRYYLSDTYISHTNNKKGLFNWLYQTIRTYSISRKVLLLKKITKKRNHLDIGCGTGEFLNACKKEGFSTKGVEPSEIARKKALDNFNLDVSANTELCNFNSDSFDSITMWHVLEHVSNLNETIEQIYRILKKDGYIFIAVPNCQSWDASYYKEFWAAWDVPIHLWHFSKKTIAFLFKKHRFELVKTKPMLFDSFYISLLSEEFKFKRKKIVKSFFIGLYSNLIGLTTQKGCSSTIYIFKTKK